jgi:hypothetical protein
LLSQHVVVFFERDTVLPAHVSVPDLVRIFCVPLATANTDALPVALPECGILRQFLGGVLGPSRRAPLVHLDPVKPSVVSGVKVDLVFVGLGPSPVVRGLLDTISFSGLFGLRLELVGVGVVFGLLLG